MHRDLDERKMTTKWPACPQCGFLLVYITDEKIFSCCCGHVKPVPDFLKAAGINEAEFQRDIADVQPEKR